MSQKFTETIHLAPFHHPKFQILGSSSHSCQVSKNKVTPVIQDQSQVLKWEQNKTTADCRKCVYCIWHTFIQNVRKQQVFNITYITWQRLATFTHDNFNPEGEVASHTKQSLCTLTNQSVCILTYSLYVYRQLTWFWLWHLLFIGCLNNMLLEKWTDMCTLW